MRWYATGSSTCDRIAAELESTCLSFEMQRACVAVAVDLMAILLAQAWGQFSPIASNLRRASALRYASSNSEWSLNDCERNNSDSTCAGTSCAANWLSPR